MDLGSDLWEEKESLLEERMPRSRDSTSDSISPRHSITEDQKEQIVSKILNHFNDEKRNIARSSEENVEEDSVDGSRVQSGEIVRSLQINHPIQNEIVQILVLGKDSAEKSNTPPTGSQVYATNNSNSNSNNSNNNSNSAPRPSIDAVSSSLDASQRLPPRPKSKKTDSATKLGQITVSSIPTSISYNKNMMISSAFPDSGSNNGIIYNASSNENSVNISSSSSSNNSIAIANSIHGNCQESLKFVSPVVAFDDQKKDSSAESQGRKSASKQRMLASPFFFLKKKSYFHPSLSPI